METLQKELFDFLAVTLGWHIGVDAYMNRVPSSKQVESCYWLIENNSFVVRQFASKTKEKQYQFILNFRHKDARIVTQEILKVEQVVNHLSCFQLPSYWVRRIQADSWNSNEDADSENFYRGVLTITVNVIDNYEDNTSS